MSDTEKVYVSLGCNCETANALKSSSKRLAAYPFDWAVSYKDINEIFKANFVGLEYPEMVVNPKFSHDIYINKKYKMLFLHYQGENHSPQSLRRVKRLQELMEDGKREVIFIRSGHVGVHHSELNEIIIDNSKFDETDDMRKLQTHLKFKYPNTKFKIYLYNRCNQCNDRSTLDDGTLFVKYIDESGNSSFNEEIQSL